MTESLLFVRGRRVVLPAGTRPASILARGGAIAAVGELGDPAPAGATVVDAGDLAVLPGLVDPHVHVNDPGRTEWEGFETATRAAAAGGIAAIVDMPLNSSPVTTDLAALAAKAAAASGRCAVDVDFWGGVVPGNAGAIEPLAAAGLRGFKAFLVHSGIDEFPNAHEEDLRAAMPAIARRGLVLLVHCELPGPIDAVRRDWPEPAGMRRHADWLASRPRSAEHAAIALVIRLARELGCRVHVVHLVSADALPMLRAARAEGLPITVETCPHYLTFASEEVPDGATEFKCAPPIREAENRERLWEGLRDATIDFVASDHSPCPPDLKRRESGDFSRAWGGVASLELGLSAVWTGARARGFSLDDVARWMASAPARLVAGLGGRKGEIAPGRDADLALFDPDAEWTVDPAALHQRHKLTPYAGRRLTGRVEATYVRGRKVFERGAAGTGTFLSPPTGRRIP